MFLWPTVYKQKEARQFAYFSEFLKDVVVNNPEPVHEIGVGSKFTMT